MTDISELASGPEYPSGVHLRRDDRRVPCEVVYVGIEQDMHTFEVVNAAVLPGDSVCADFLPSRSRLRVGGLVPSWRE